MSRHPRIVLGNNKCSINICRVNELICTLIHQLTMREMTLQVLRSRILWISLIFSCLLLKFRMMGRYSSQLFCCQGQRYVMNLKPVRSWALFSKCSLSELRNDYFPVWLALPVCHTLMPCQRAVTLRSSQHTLLEGNHATVSHSPVSRPATGTPVFSLSPLIQTELFWIVSHVDSRSFPIMLCGFPG